MKSSKKCYLCNVISEFPGKPSKAWVHFFQNATLVDENLFCFCTLLPFNDLHWFRMAIGLLVKHAALWQSARNPLGTTSSKVPCQWLGCHFLLLQINTRQGPLAGTTKTCSELNGLLHTVTYLLERLNKIFSGLFVHCGTRGSAYTLTPWAIKPFNGLNAVHKTSHCVWIYSLNCNTHDAKVGKRRGSIWGSMCTPCAHEVDVTVCEPREFVHINYSHLHSVFSSTLLTVIWTF